MKLKAVGTVIAARAALHVISGGALSNLFSFSAWMPGAVISDVQRLTAPRAIAVGAQTSAIEVQMRTSDFEVPAHWQGNTSFLSGIFRR